MKFGRCSPNEQSTFNNSLRYADRLIPLEAGCKEQHELPATEHSEINPTWLSFRSSAHHKVSAAVLSGKVPMLAPCEVKPPQEAQNRLAWRALSDLCRLEAFNHRDPATKSERTAEFFACGACSMHNALRAASCLLCLQSSALERILSFCDNKCTNGSPSSTSRTNMTLTPKAGVHSSASLFLSGRPRRRLLEP